MDTTRLPWQNIQGILAHSKLKNYSTELFHDRVKAALTDLLGCTSILDNILVWGRTPEEHKANLDACLTSLEEKGVTLRREKCTFGATSVSWFGTIFSKSGMSADPGKIKAIKEATLPQNADEVKSFLQASLPTANKHKRKSFRP